MNELISFLQSHASVRQFTDRQITPEEEQMILTTAQQSPTSSNLQAYSVITIRDQATKARVAEWSGNQQHIIDCPLFLVFCADLFRLRKISERAGYLCNSEYAEIFMVATIDTALVAERALMAAQALGMGGVMVGAVRNRIQEISDLLELPDLIYPVMGMSLGFPKAVPKVKPRLSLQAVRHVEKYHAEDVLAGVDEYDGRLQEFGHLQGREVQPEKYPNFKGPYTWSEHTARRMANDAPAALRPHMLEYLRKRGFLLK